MLKLEPTLDHSDVQGVEVTLKVDPLIGLPVKRLTVKLVLADHVLVIRLVFKRGCLLALYTTKHWSASV